MTGPRTETAKLEALIRPIIGIENSSAQEVFDIMADRFRHAALSVSRPAVKGLEWAEATGQIRGTVAVSVIGDYLIMPYLADGGVRMKVPHTSGWARYAAPDEAKAAAQSDFEQRILSSLSPPIGGAAMTDVIWFSPEIPPATPKGTERYFIVAVRRAHNDKVWSFPAAYLNAYQLIFEVCECEAEHSEDGCPCTGWYTASSDGEYDENYSPLLSPGDELVAWSEIQMHPLDARLVSKVQP